MSFRSDLLKLTRKNCQLTNLLRYIQQVILCRIIQKNKINYWHAKNYFNINKENIFVRYFCHLVTIYDWNVYVFCDYSFWWMIREEKWAHQWEGTVTGCSVKIHSRVDTKEKKNCQAVMKNKNRLLIDSTVILMSRFLCTTNTNHKCSFCTRLQVPFDKTWCKKTEIYICMKDMKQPVLCTC